MACPFFVPLRRLEMAGWLRPPRLPLGDPFGGACHARPSEIVEPPETRQRELCNCGYARGRCERFPGGDAADAVRFSITEETSARLSLVYVLERAHAPVEFGTLEYADDRLGGPPMNEVLARQARAFLESHLSRRSRTASV